MAVACRVELGVQRQYDADAADCVADLDQALSAQWRSLTDIFMPMTLVAALAALASLGVSSRAASVPAAPVLTGSMPA